MKCPVTVINEVFGLGPLRRIFPPKRVVGLYLMAAVEQR
jgi:hypothetical protein